MHTIPCLARIGAMRKSSACNSADIHRGALGAMSTQQESATTVVVWDLPVRLFHWLIVAGIAVSWWSAEYRFMNVHRYSGYAMLGLLVFRIYWGLFGSPTARFAQFVRGPGAIAKYLREPAAHATPGHNPLGGLSVIMMLLLLLVQVGLGLFVTDIDGLESGPLSYLVSFETSRILAERHETIFNVLLAFTALHIAAILFYLFARRTNLIAAMITGRRASITQAAPIKLASMWRIWPGVALALFAVWFVTRTG
jgi:cytochrome b